MKWAQTFEYPTPLLQFDALIADDLLDGIGITDPISIVVLQQGQNWPFSFFAFSCGRMQNPIGHSPEKRAMDISATHRDESLGNHP